ncbi:hypothetical protein TPAR_01678 [Tolypocladium paradoxum]|uniref:Uncharacterized protein n=1 Tax=Tolypocladium paradoxum TaxID=94208 RepID=A0A2S4L6Q2_9HYPO|nr:hypothetical protein TPAR_01678 [Tolypocladium paradoxum]
MTSLASQVQYRPPVSCGGHVKRWRRNRRRWRRKSSSTASCLLVLARANSNRVWPSLFHTPVHVDPPRSLFLNRSALACPALSPLVAQAPAASWPRTAMAWPVLLPLRKRFFLAWQLSPGTGTGRATSELHFARAEPRLE